ncbi:unnamed protein product [Ilex paraguariensis]|uniref:IST1-like protein n=1 Tax=Ilex paraguariensis TaxID=185542 RepID=A0ABC8SAQ0_9AQUA
MDSFFNKGGFKATKCKTLLKLTIPRIKLLRNRREIQIKQMRREIAKLLETGQEATARIRVEHIIREEKMMAAQEIIELFCELIVVRLPIIEAQRECPLDLKEAISSVCFAAPRCADLLELLQAQMLFAGKYGKEFVSAATELMPECGVNRQLIELLSIRAPAPDVKLKLLKEIAEQHELDWDPSTSETELLKLHEDLLNGPIQFVSGSKLPLPKEKHEEPLYSASEEVSTPEMLPFPPSALSDLNEALEKPFGANENVAHELNLEPEEVLRQKSVIKECESPNVSVSPKEDKQFVPFISPPLVPSASFPMKQSNPASSLSRTKSEANVDLQDVLAAAQAAAESAERAAAAARTAASLAEVRISELIRKKTDEVSDDSGLNPFHVDSCQSDKLDKPHLDHQNSLNDSDSVSNSLSTSQYHGNNLEIQGSNLPSYNGSKVEVDSSNTNKSVLGQETASHQPQRLPSMDDETYFSYPNLFTSQGSNLGSATQ